MFITVFEDLFFTHCTLVTLYITQYIQSKQESTEKQSFDELDERDERDSAPTFLMRDQNQNSTS